MHILYALGFLMDGVHIWRTDCLLCVDDNNGLNMTLNSKVRVKNAYNLSAWLIKDTSYFLLALA